MRRLIKVPPSRGLGDYGRDPNTTPRTGRYSERVVFNERGPEEFELLNGPRRAITQFPFQAGPVAIQILPENYRRFYLIIQNKSTTDTMFYGYNSAVDANSGIGLAPGAAGPPQTPGGNTLNDYMCPTDAIWVFCATAAQLGVCAEGVLIS